MSLLLSDFPIGVLSLSFSLMASIALCHFCIFHRIRLSCVLQDDPFSAHPFYYMFSSVSGICISPFCCFGVRLCWLCLSTSPPFPLPPPSLCSPSLVSSCGCIRLRRQCPVLLPSSSASASTPPSLSPFSSSPSPSLSPVLCSS